MATFGCFIARAPARPFLAQGLLQRNKIWSSSRQNMHILTRSRSVAKTVKGSREFQVISSVYSRQQARNMSSQGSISEHPTVRNVAIASVLVAFVSGVYYFTIQQIRMNNDFGDDFDKPANAIVEDDEE